MRIEDVTSETLGGMGDSELRYIRSRCLNIFDRYFARSDVQKAVGMDRRLFLTKYLLLRSEMENRGMKLFRERPLDKEVHNRIFKASLWKLDVPALGDMVAVPNYVSVSGEFIKSPVTVEKIDVVIRSEEKHRNEGFEAKIGELVKEQTDKEPNFIYDVKGPDSSFIPLFDLVLKSHDETRKMKAKKEDIKVQKPEETENMIRIPVTDCEVTATLTLDAAQGIKALYCGKVKKIRTYLFDKKKKAWTMASARAWIKEHSAKSEKALGQGRGVGGDRQGIGGTDVCVCPDCGHEVKHKRNIPCADMECPECGAQMEGKAEKSTVMKIIKVDKKKQIVGGIIYEPDEIDSQGEFTDAEEIEKAMEKFMEKYATDTNRIRINHKGKRYHFPIIECFQPEEDTKKGGEIIKKGAWWLEVKVTNPAIWKMIEDKELEGFSMGGTARA